MATKSAFHTVGRLYELEGEYKFKHFTTGTYYSKETSKGMILVNEDGDRVGFLRKPGGESKVSAWITWCMGNLSLVCFRAKDMDGTLIHGEYDVTFAYEYEVDENRAPREKTDNVLEKKNRW